MKRSEMVNNIEILLESIGYVGPSDSGEKVMELIESVDMYPPPYDTHVNWDNDDHMTTRLTYLLPLEDESYWEKEDE